MSKYEIYKDYEKIDIYSNNECFDKEDIDSLWIEHNILFLNGSIVAIWVEQRKNENPIIHFMQEDDGHLYWRKEKDISFDSSWIDDYIKVLTITKSSITNFDK